MTSGRRSVRYGWAVLLAVPLLFYLALPTRNFYWDGVAFAINIEKHLPAADLIHPSHLVYALCGAWLYGLVEAAGIHTRALYVLQFANSLLAELCVLLLYTSLRLRGVSAGLSMPLALALGFSATWWKFAADANAYMPSIFLLLCAYVLLERPKTVVLAGIAQAGAMLFHELAVLFLIVALVRLRESRRLTFVYLAAALIPVAGAYVAAYNLVASQARAPGFLSWITSHSPDSGFSWNPLADAALSIRGTFRLFFGGKPRDIAGGLLSDLGLAALAIAAALFVMCLWRAMRRGASITAPPLHLLIWAGIYAAFLFFWMPQNTFYRLFYLPPLIAILGSMLRPAPAAPRLVWLFASVLLTWNFVFLIYPQSRPELNAPLRFAMSAQEVWSPGTPILFYRFHPDLWTISYFNPQASWMGMERVDLDQMARSLKYAQREKKPLWLEETAYDLLAASPEGRNWLAMHEQPAKLLRFKDDKHEFRFHYAQ